MGDQTPQLFDQLKVCIVCTGDLSQDSAHQLASTLEENGGDPFIYQPPAECPDLAQFNYLMSATIDFPGFDAANDALIPVVKPQWMQASLSKGKLANVRQYSPDPRLFLNDVTVTCGDIPEGDKDAIIGGVLAKGGTYNPKLTGLCTHLVDLTVNSDKAQIVKKRNLTNVKIVLPHWFDDCLKLGKRIDERPYMLPDPEILRSAPDAPIRPTDNRDIIGASTPEPITLPTPITSPVKRKLSVFNGKVIMLSADLKIGVHLQDTISTLIREGGGEVTSEVSKATTLICRYREGFAYRVASRLNKDVGNLAWLYHLMTYNTWTSPYRRLLHYPVPRTPIPGFEKLKISLSNYVGEARSYLENLITATGAEPTKTLRQDNTHLVTAHDNSEKVNAAKEWGLYVVNHLWLEECYAKWRRLPESEHRYTHFPRRTNLGEVVGQTRLDRSSLESMFFPSEEAPANTRKAMEQTDQNAASRKALSPTELDENIASDTTNATPRAGRPRKADSKNLHTPARTRLSADGKENDTPSSTSSRKSKDAATAKLHEIAPDIALYEKEMKRVGGVIYGGRRKTDEDRVEINKSKKRSSMEAQSESEEEDNTDSKRQKRAKLPPIAMHLLITGYKKWVGNMKKEDADKRQLRELGIMVVQDARKCSHVAAPSVLRTPKFVNALAYGPVIVRVEFIEQCLKKNELLDADDYPLNDKEAEKKYDFSLEQSKANAKANKNKLLQGYQIYCVETIRGGFDAFKSIVDTNGGVCNLFRGRVAHQIQREESEDESDAEQQLNRKEVYLLSSAAPEHQKLWPRFRQLVHNMGKTPRIVRVDWLLDMAMSQESRTAEDYELNEEMVEQSEE